MSITTRSEYGLRAMILLAEQLGDERLSAAEISRREDIPVKYLEQILAELKKAELVRSRAGARGGYQLARPAREITVGEVVTALDGPVTPMTCNALEREPGPRESASDVQVGQRLRPLWLRLQRALREVLDQTTLHQLAFCTQLDPPPCGDARSPTRPPTEGRMYHI